MKIYFEDLGRNTYESKAWNEDIASLHIPQKITFTQHGSGTSELPSKKLLELHRTIGEVLHMSGAAENIHVLLRRLEGKDVDVNGGTSLGDLVSLQLGRTTVLVY